MNLYLVKAPDTLGWDVFLGFVVAAKSEKEARETYPGRYGNPTSWDGKGWQWVDCDGKPVYEDDWPAPDTLKVRKIGTASPRCKKGVVLAEYRNG